MGDAIAVKRHEDENNEGRYTSNAAGREETAFRAYDWEFFRTDDY